MLFVSSLITGDDSADPVKCLFPLFLGKRCNVTMGDLGGPLLKRSIDESHVRIVLRARVEPVPNKILNRHLDERMLTLPLRYR